jgi:hypothetical protein
MKLELKKTQGITRCINSGLSDKTKVSTKLKS